MGRLKAGVAAAVLGCAAMLVGPGTASPQGIFSFYPAPVPATYKLDASSKEGLVVFRLPPGMMTSRFELTLFSLTEDANPAKIGGMRTNVVRLGSPKPGEAFGVAVVKRPGRYLIRDLAVQVSWRACFNAATPVFDVKPGTVTFIGQFNPSPALQAISRDLPGKTNMGNQLYLWDQRAPLFPAADLPGAQEALAAFLTMSLPGVTAPIEPAASTETAFQTSKVFLQKQCQ